MQRKLGHINLVLSMEAELALIAYQWPGNVRELEHVLSRAALKANSERGSDERLAVINLEHLGLEVSTNQERPNGSTSTSSLSREDKLASDGFASFGVESGLEGVTLKDAMDIFKTKFIRSTLDQFQGNRSNAAQALGLDRSNFHRLLKRLDIE